MAFQRSHSKVWWGSFPESTLNYGSNIYHSLDNQFKTVGNLSKIEEVQETSSIWYNSHNSPGSLRSQDSGFSDNDDSSHLKGSKKSGSKLNVFYDSPSSVKTIQTPPTVVRRKLEISSNSAVQRLSFSAPNSPVSFTNECDVISQIDKISLIENTPKTSAEESCHCSGTHEKSIRRRRVTNRKIRRSLISSNQEASMLSSDDEAKEYNNETVYFGYGEDDNNNLSSKTQEIYSPLRKNISSLFTISTSTPKSKDFEEINSSDIYKISMNGITLPYYIEYDNVLLNGHAPSVQHWLDDIRMSYNHEVMSTLQTKSIAQEAFRNLKITTTTVAKIVRQLQTRSLVLQGEFERVDKILRCEKPDTTLRDALVASKDLTESVQNFSKILERRSVFFTECHTDRKKFEDNIEHIRLITRDLNISLDKQHYLDQDSLYEDIQVLKRYVLITIRLVFEKLIRVIVLNIENSKCDLVLRANLNMISTLSNIDYTGFASLNDAFMKNQAIRVFLLICIDSKFSSVRALALRALATVCSTTESIRQLGDEDGVEIVKDILAGDTKTVKRTEPERREAVSLLTQITAPWHGKDHSVFGLKDSVESIVESLTDIIEKTICCQTLLLCAASLNNLSRLEVTSIYSIMSNESVIKLQEAVERRGPGVSIFLYEQIVSMLYNMSANKKCHSHLANRNIIKFIANIFQSQFYERYKSRAETDSHRRTIKGVLHIFSRLIHESVVGQEILEHNFVPIFSKIEKDLHGDSEYSKDISYLSRQMNDSFTQKSFNRSTESRSSNASGSRLYFNKQESFV